MASLIKKLHCQIKKQNQTLSEYDKLKGPRFLSKGSWPCPSQALWPTPIQLGKPLFSKKNAFSENFRTAFEPPYPRPFCGKIYSDFLRKFILMQKKCNNIFKIGNAPPHSNAKTSAISFFGSKITPPPPPFENFTKIHPFWRKETSLTRVAQVAQSCKPGCEDF